MDTSALLAALDAGDPDHHRCASLIAGADEDLVIPVLVLAELEYWCSQRLPREAWTIFGEDLLEGAYRIEGLSHSDLARSLEVQRAYSDMPVGIVDASVLAVVERLKEPKLATLDHRHVAALRPSHAPALELLPR
ncbi:MAG: PIN domain-containing protein [Actinomycetota bacterium]|nr:PIN domain-containing protein [Actinomycetota bacterium]